MHSTVVYSVQCFASDNSTVVYSVQCFASDKTTDPDKFHISP